MSELPLSIGILHFTGIGGIGMSGIAEILFELGYQVQGSDNSENANVRRLRAKGIKGVCGQAAETIPRSSRRASASSPSSTAPRCSAN